MKLVAEILVTAAILIGILVLLIVGALLTPFIAVIGGVLIIGLIVFFLVHDPVLQEKPEE